MCKKLITDNNKTTVQDFFNALFGGAMRTLNLKRAIFIEVEPDAVDVARNRLPDLYKAAYRVYGRSENEPLIELRIVGRGSNE